MTGTKKGGIKAYKKILARDPEFYIRIGTKGGSSNRGRAHLKGFGSNRELASRLGLKGGVAKRKVKNV